MLSQTHFLSTFDPFTPSMVFHWDTENNWQAYENSSKPFTTTEKNLLILQKTITGYHPCYLANEYRMR